jgi:hypothetical protein
MPDRPGSHPKALITLIGAVLSGATKAVVGWWLGRLTD